jgi:hypothetical protein
MDSGRRQRAEARRARAVIHRAQLSEHERDLTPIQGVEAIALALRLTREAYGLTGEPEPQYTREQTPYRFVPWPAK